MEGTSMKEKEMKRRFFRRTKRSLDSSSPIPSHSPSLENNSMFALAACSNPSAAPSSSIGGVVPTVSSHRAFGATGESSSLDETVINNRRMDHQHRRFMAAPRRARSAERFEGMRVAFNSPGDEIHPRTLRGSPQLVRTAGGASVTDLGRGSVGSPTMPMPSPPPPYASAVTDITGPPSYRQAVAAMTVQAQGGGKTAQGGKINNSTGNRYMPHRGGTQSFDNTTIVGGGLPSSMTTGLRSAASVPAFTDDIICNCSKCQALRRPNEMGYGDNDAVYMESQAFLMHEIMTDGMAFCSIM